MNRHRRFLAAALAAISWLGACTVGPDYRKPAPPDGAAAPLAPLGPAVATGEETPDAWWQLYDDRVLDRLLAQAFAANLDLKAAEANLSAARAMFEGARALRYPTTGLEAGGIYGRDPMTDEILEVGGHKPFSDWIFDSLADVSYEVDLFGRVRRSIEAAEDSSEAVAAARDGLKVTVAAETARAYAQFCALGEQIAVAQHSVSLVAREAEITSRRHDAGANSDFDVARADALVAQVRASIAPLEGQRRAALFQLAALLGRTPGEAPIEAEGCVAPPRLKAAIPVGDGAALLARRPDVRAAERRLAAATAQIGVATAELYPRISLTGFWGAVSDKVDLLNTEDALAWGVGPKISWAFPNQAGPRARIHQAESGADAALAAFDQAVLQALKETAQALATYATELDHRTALKEFQAKEQRAFDLAHDQFAAGSISNLDVLTAEQTLVGADAAVAASDAAIVQDQIAVFKALGGGWKAAPAADVPPA
jgi:NodT family efflux transporter outer membrane factor (OMF) lipoprotein